MPKGKLTLAKGKRNGNSMARPAKTGSTGAVNSVATAAAGLKGKY